MDIAVSLAPPGVSGTPRISTTLLRNVRLLSLLGETDLAMIARVARRESCARGSLIFAAGNPSDSVFILISGHIKVFMEDVEGREMILRILGPGEFFGEMGLIDNNAPWASVVTLEACELIRIARSDFTRCLAANFDMTMTVMRDLVKRLHDANNLIGSLALVDVLGRVVHLLRQAAEVVDGQKVVRKKISVQDIARRVGASRETVSRVLKHLQLRGQVEVLGDSLIIRDDLLPSH